MGFFKGLGCVFYVFAIAGCSIPKPGAFYQTAALKTQPPGTLISVEPYTPSIQGAAAYRVLYNSTDIYGDIIPVSGVVYIPLAPPPPGGRNTVAWAHPTTGIAPGCAPSLDAGGTGAISLADSIPGLDQFISAGDIVAATDYQGMGVPGVHPYLIGDSEGRGILDSVRAARHLPGAYANGKFAVWGHSQGGQAALFAGQMAKPYAPELSLVGVAAAAPPTDMKGEFAEPFHSDSGRLLGAYLYYSWSITYHVPVTTLVYPQAVPAMDKAASKCINSLGQGINAILAASALNPVFLAHSPGDTPHWTSLLDENSPGLAPAGAPLLIVQGSKDPTVEPHWTRSFVAKVCAQHETLDYVEFKGVKHLMIAYKSAPLVSAWIADRFTGAKPPDNCKT
jgi:acetyl esterase/lipase